MKLEELTIEAGLAKRTPRDIIETRLIELFPELRPLAEEAMADINAHKDGSYGFSYLGMLLYANGRNVLSTSTNFPQGLIYEDRNKDAIFGVGVFYRMEKPGIPAFHIIAPRGAHWQEAVNEFSSKVLEHWPNAEIFVRHLSPDDHNRLLKTTNLDRIVAKVEIEDRRKEERSDHFPLRKTNSDWTVIQERPWLDRAPQEDETFNYGLINLDAVITDPEHDIFARIPWLPKGDKVKKRQHYRAFKQFLKENGLSFTLESYMPEMESAARTLIKNHFDHLREQNKAIGSTAEDYENIIASIRLAPSVLQSAGIHMYMGFLSNDSGIKIPVSFFALEETGKGVVAGYATITNRAPDLLNEKLPDIFCGDGSGFSQMPTYALGELMYKMKEKGLKFFHWGGSETLDLDKGKRTYGAEESPSFWAANRHRSSSSHSLH